MKQKLIIPTGIVLLLIAGVSFAAFLNGYGTIKGTAKNVLPPEFYIGSVTDETVLVNKKSSDCEYFGISDEFRTFTTREDFGGVNFSYLPRINFQVRAKGVTNSASSLPILGLAFGYYDRTGVPQYLANTTIALGDTMQNYSVFNILASKKPEDVHRFFYEFKKICPLDDTSCSISVSKCAGEFYTKVRLSK